MQKQIFTSYSRREQRQAHEIVQLLRMAGAEVFRDEDSIEPGKKWRVEITNAIENADVVLVLWSRNAAESTEVKAEYELGMSLGKDIVPVLLEKAPLPDTLAEYQYLNVSELFMPRSPEGLKRSADELGGLLARRIFLGENLPTR